MPALFQLKVNVICEKCQCGGRPEPSAQVCHGKGNLVCGGCECQGDYFGRACQCNLKESGSSNMQDLENKCRPNGTDDSSPICNNRGGCTCGQCSCNAHSLGQFCQCSVKDCPKNALTGQACSGHGFCRCSKDVQTSCACAEGWTGENCGCSLSQESCKDDITGEICFGRGEKTWP